MLFELPDVYPNGIAFDSEQRLMWTESRMHRIRRLIDGERTTFCQLSDGHVPDGMAIAADGRMFVCTTISEGVTVVSPDGEVLEEIHLGHHATNCIFEGSNLYVTATQVGDIEASATHRDVLARRDRRDRPPADPGAALSRRSTRAAARDRGRRHGPGPEEREQLCGVRRNDLRRELHPDRGERLLEPLPRVRPARGRSRAGGTPRPARRSRRAVPSATSGGYSSAGSCSDAPAGPPEDGQPVEAADRRVDVPVGDERDPEGSPVAFHQLSRTSDQPGPLAVRRRGPAAHG